MNETILEIKKRRARAMLLAGMACVVYLVAGLSLGASVWFLVVSFILAGIVLFYTIIGHFNSVMQKRLAYVATTLLDPQMLEEDAGQVFSKTNNGWKNRYGVLYYELTRLNLLGDFESALDVCNELSTLTQKNRDINACNLMYLYVRTHQMEKAAELAPKISELCNKDDMFKFSCNRVLGIYYSEMGDFQRAYELLSSSLQDAKSNSEKLGVHYDLALLAEKEGNTGIALGHYREAAEIGPKAWMGQEAARRLEVITAAVK